jgi:hypothetical protein
MALDIKSITNTFIAIAAKEVGSQLSTIRKSGVMVPAVILARDTQTKPDYPYIVVDIITIDDSGSWRIAQGVNEAGEPWVASYYRILFQYTVYGPDSLSIAHSLKGKFRVDRVLNDVETGTSGKVEDVFAVSSLPERLSSRYLEVAAFNLSLTMTDIVIDAETGVIANISLDGSLTNTGDSTLDLDIVVPVP